MFKFESSLWDLKLRLSRESKRAVVQFESSLWDLKPALVSPQFVRMFRLKAPYGIWNLWHSLCPSRLLYVWKLPMGFETVIALANKS